MMQKKLKIVRARSMDNGIRFYSKRHKGYVAIATVDEVGNIKAEWTTMEKYKKMYNKHDKSADMKKIFIFILCVLSLMFESLLNWKIDKDFILSMRLSLLWYAFLCLGGFAIFTYIERKKTKSAYKFHAAEHMVINAFTQLKRVPNIEEIRQYSRFSNDCSTNVITQIAIGYATIFLCTFIRNPLYFFIVILSVNIIVIILLQCGFLNFFQKFTTITPTDKELYVAIGGMNTWVENEKQEEGKV